MGPAGVPGKFEGDALEALCARGSVVGDKTSLRLGGRAKLIPARNRRALDSEDIFC